MRFRTEVVPVVLVVSASAMTMPLVSACKKQETALDASINGPIIIKRREDIPPVMGGIAVPYTPPPPSATPPAPMGKAPSGGGAGLAAPAPTVEAAPQPSALAIQHNHPPDQPCNHPLKKEEVEKALSDLQSKPK
jgi:hypothetical protein